MRPATTVLTHLSTADDARPFVDRIAEIERSSFRAAIGNDDLAITPRQHLAYLAYQRYQREVYVVASDGETGVPAGFFRMILPTVGQTDVAEMDLAVDPAYRRRGIGSALLAEAERIADIEGRGTFVTYSAHAAEPPAGTAALVPPTGSGRIAASDPGAQFMAAHGYRLEQIDRQSELRLPADPGLLDRLEREAVAAAGPDYRVHVWHNEIPERWRDEMATLARHMSADVPSGEVDFGDAHWDAEKVAYWQERARAQGIGQVYAVAEHVPTGTLAAYTTLIRPAGGPPAVFQDDTLVVAAHRGHRLGMLIKVANLRELATVWPDALRLHTWNAEENSHMLAINVALGFRPASTSAMWRRPPRG